MYKLITSARDTDDLSIGFDRDCDGRQQELTNKKIKKENNMREICSEMFLVLQNIKEKLLKG